MNILFYLEPHYIRESSTSHIWIAREIVKMYQNEFMLKKQYKSKHTLKMSVSRHANNKLRKEFEPSAFTNLFIGLEKDENDFIDTNYVSEWNDESISLWTELLTGKGEISEFYFKILERIYASYKFDVIVYWSTNGAVKMFSDTYSIPSIAMELGPSRSPFLETIYFDFQGVNGNSYTNNISPNFIQSDYSIDEIKTILPFFMPHQKALDSMCDILDIDVSGAIYSNLGKNVLIPLQLKDDSNIVLFSTYNSMNEFLNDLVPKLTNAGYTCYVKPHPGNVDRKVNTDDHNQCKEFCEKFEAVYWLDNFDNQNNLVNLYSKMDYTVVVNSSVGFENMLLGNIIIPLGKSPYNIGNGFPTLNDLISNKIDIEEYEKMITKIVNLLLFNYLYFRKDFYSFDTFVHAVKYNIYLEDIFKKNPDKFTETVANKNIKTLISYLNY